MTKYSTISRRPTAASIPRIILFTVTLSALGSSPLFAEGSGEAPSPASLTVLLPHFGDPLQDGPVSNYILENFAEPNNIDFKWIAVPRAELHQTLILLLSSGDAPDLSQASLSFTSSLALDGRLFPLDDLIAHHGANIADTAWGAALPYGRFGTDTLWSIPRANTLPATDSGWVMRQDWLDDLGLLSPTNTDSFLETALAIKANDPGNAMPDLAVIGISSDFGAQIRDVITSFLDPVVINSARDRTSYGWGLYPGNTLMAAPGFLEGLRFLNDLNAQGLFPPDWPATDTQTMYRRYLLSGRMFTSAAPYVTFLDRWRPSLQEFDPSAHWVPVFPFTASDDVSYKSAPPLASDALFVPDTASEESATAAIKYLNWHADPLIHRWMRYGDGGAPGSEPPDPRWYEQGNIMSCGPLCTEIYRANSHFRHPDYTPEIDSYIDATYNNAFRRIIVPQSDGAAISDSLIAARQKEWIATIIVAPSDRVDDLFREAIQELDALGAGDRVTSAGTEFDRAFPQGLPSPQLETPVSAAPPPSSSPRPAPADAEETPVEQESESSSEEQPQSVPSDQDQRPTEEASTPSAPDTDPATGGSSQAPDLPWPPMDPTGRHVIHRSIFGDAPLTAVGVNDVLSAALSASGYAYTYYLVEGDGYAMVTRMEQFDCTDNVGGIRFTHDRWVLEVPPLKFGDIFSAAFWNRILTVKPIGCYRTLVFLVGGEPFSTETGEAWDQDSAERLGRFGSSQFPHDLLGKVEYGDSVHCEVLVYQYERRINVAEALRVEPGATGAIGGLRHLAKSVSGLLTSEEMDLARRGDT